jgi:hypothetical protein
LRRVLDDYTTPVGGRLAGVEESLRKRDRFRLHPKRVGVHDAARQEERVELLRLGFVEGDVDRELVSPVREVPSADVLIPGRDDARLGAGLVEHLARFVICSIRIATFSPFRVSFAIFLSPLMSSPLASQTSASCT